jgi:hypothetical protein
MAIAAKAPPPGGDGGALGLSFPGGNDSQPKPPKAKTQGKKRGGRSSRDKGTRFELALVRLLLGAGFGAEKISRAGYSGADLSCPVLGADRVIECKSRATGFRELYRWLENADAVILKSDRRDALCIVRLRFALEVASAAQRRKP